MENKVRELLLYILLYKMTTVNSQCAILSAQQSSLSLQQSSLSLQQSSLSLQQSSLGAASVIYKKPSKKEEVKTFSADELPRLEPNIKKTEDIYSIGEENVEKCIKTITFNSDAKENMLVIFMAKCKLCNLLFDSEDSSSSGLSVKNVENKCVCNTKGSDSINENNEENIERKAFFMEYYYAKYLIHYIDGIDLNKYRIRGCNYIYYVDEEESKVINKYLDKMENVCKFPLIRYKKMLNIIITANRNQERNQGRNQERADKKNLYSASTSAEGSNVTSEEEVVNSTSTADANEVQQVEQSVPVVYGGADYINPTIEDLTESLIDKTKHRNFIKYATLEERREARLKQRLQLLNYREVCDVCKCDVRYGGTARHILTTKHLRNLEINKV